MLACSPDVTTTRAAPSRIAAVTRCCSGCRTVPGDTLCSNKSSVSQYKMLLSHFWSPSSIKEEDRLHVACQANPDGFARDAVQRRVAAVTDAQAGRARR